MHATDFKRALDTADELRGLLNSEKQEATELRLQLDALKVDRSNLEHRVQELRAALDRVKGVAARILSGAHATDEQLETARSEATRLQSLLAERNRELAPAHAALCELQALCEEGTIAGALARHKWGLALRVELDDAVKSRQDDRAAFVVENTRLKDDAEHMRKTAVRKCGEVETALAQLQDALAENTRQGERLNDAAYLLGRCAARLADAAKAMDAGTDRQLVAGARLARELEAEIRADWTPPASDNSSFRQPEPGCGVCDDDGEVAP